MTPDQMRNIDRYFGVPITFMVTLLLTVWQILFRPQGQRPKRILFIELSEMGSTILADPAMRKARDHFLAELFFVIFTKNRPSLTLLQTIPDANIFTIDQTSLGSILTDVVRFRFWCVRNRIDTVVDLELFSRFSTLLSWLSGAVNRAGFYAFHDEGLYRGELLTCRVAYNPHIHIAKNFVSLINALAAAKPELPFSKKEVPDSEIVLPVVKPGLPALAAMRDKIKMVAPHYDETAHRLVLINPNSSELLPQRRWSPENYHHLISEIVSRYPDILVLITGAPSELPGAEALVAAISHERCVNLTGHLIVEELPALYTLAALMVTNDSGPGHFSAITRMPTIVLYGPETPKLYGSLGNVHCLYANLACSPCVSAANHRKTSCVDNVCLQAITPAMALSSVREILEGHGHA
ncbi:MAG: glycosyltransferase family 9 protein [Proteobacteria bacterium]|nr:glycosyltransferase family 9 protein [Desulfobulbaceae bacterium]MBU4151769.1 glycosyltransferase family 9 protein [Pseudomonadota bacterium]MDP2107372.1 glycosyltransferase family 9 protein [Desulfobulbaceae bacterium]